MTEESPMKDSPLSAATRSAVFAAWALCDGTEGTVHTDEDGEHFRVPKAEWEALSAALDALDELIQEDAQPARPSYAVTLLVEEAVKSVKTCTTCRGFGFAVGGLCYGCGGSGREKSRYSPDAASEISPQPVATIEETPAYPPVL